MNAPGTTKTVEAAAGLDEYMMEVVSEPDMVEGFADMDDAGKLPATSLSPWARAIDLSPEDKPKVQWPNNFRHAEAHLLRSSVQ